MDTTKSHTHSRAHTHTHTVTRVVVTLCLLKQQLAEAASLRRFVCFSYKLFRTIFATVFPVICVLFFAQLFLVFFLPFSTGCWLFLLLFSRVWLLFKIFIRISGVFFFGPHVFHLIFVTFGFRSGPELSVF